MYQTSNKWNIKKYVFFGTVHLSQSSAFKQINFVLHHLPSVAEKPKLCS